MDMEQDKVTMHNGLPVDRKDEAMEVFTKFQEDYKELMDDQVLCSVIQGLDLYLMINGYALSEDPVENFDKRLRYVGDLVRFFVTTIRKQRDGSDE